jgi:flagellar protein FliS
MITQQYENQKVLSASPMELILMLYDGGIRHLNRALEHGKIADDIESRNRVHENLLEAQSYITELTCALDVERGGEMATQIERLYEFMLNQLVEANTQGSHQPVEIVRKMLVELREGWAQAMANMDVSTVSDAVPVERVGSFRFSG